MLLERTRTLLPAWAALHTSQSSSAMLAARLRLCEIRTCKQSYCFQLYYIQESPPAFRRSVERKTFWLRRWQDFC